MRHTLHDGGFLLFCSAAVKKYFPLFFLLSSSFPSERITAAPNSNHWQTSPNTLQTSSYRYCRPDGLEYIVTLLALSCSGVYSSYRSDTTALIVTSALVTFYKSSKYIYRKIRSHHSKSWAPHTSSYGTFTTSEDTESLTDSDEELGLPFDIPIVAVDLNRGFDTGLGHIIDNKRYPEHLWFAGKIPKLLYHGLREPGIGREEVFRRGLRSPRMIIKNVNMLNSHLPTETTASIKDLLDHQNSIYEYHDWNIVSSTKDLNVASFFNASQIVIFKPDRYAIDLNSTLGRLRSSKAYENEVDILNGVAPENIYGFLIPSIQNTGILYVNPNYNNE